MHFKPSAGVFVGGLAASIGGMLLVLLAAASGEEGAFMVLIGILVGIAGTIMLCIGAARALVIIDSLPAAFYSLNNLHASQQGASTPQPYQ